jgi:glycosyltransferase involved in cell wall biosynthesis
MGRTGDQGRVTVSIPYWGCPRTIRKAVYSVLAQTYEDLQLVVVNDGDNPSSVWGILDDITDPRLIRFDLPKNRGRYYADAVVLGACDTTWFTIHDADDWSESPWLCDLVVRAVEDDAVAAFSPQVLHHGTRTKIEQVNPLLSTRVRIPQLTQLAHHAGLYRTTALRAAGGYHPAYRIGYDTMIVNLVRMIGPCAVSPQIRYHRMYRFGSLTTSRQTGFGSSARAAVKRQLQDLYQDAINTPPEMIADMVRATIPPPLGEQLERDTKRLREMINQ